MRLTFCGDAIVDIIADDRLGFLARPCCLEQVRSARRATKNGDSKFADACTVGQFGHNPE
jgi:hypothetical protein